MFKDEYLIQIRSEGNKSLAKILEPISYDQREGTSYMTIGVALRSNHKAAILAAVEDAFGS